MNGGHIKNPPPPTHTPPHTHTQVPIFVAFDVDVPIDGSQGDVGSDDGGAGGEAAGGPVQAVAVDTGCTAAPPAEARMTTRMACIFKVGDDIRQDVLAIQVSVLLSWVAHVVQIRVSERWWCCDANVFGALHIHNAHASLKQV
jgi:hypothetical protein